MEKFYKGRFWGVIITLSLFLIPMSTISILIKGEIKSYFEVIAIITLLLLLFSLSQKQTLSLSISSIDQKIGLKVYHPFFKVRLYELPLDALVINFETEHIARGKYANVIKLIDRKIKKEYKLSAQMLWWEDSVLDQIVMDFKRLGKL